MPARDRHMVAHMQVAANWSPHSGDYRLGPGEIHVWRANIERPSAAALQILSDDERERASRFVFARDRNRFVNARATLRMLLGRYLQRPSGDVAFDYAPEGKPRLHALVGDLPIRFNLSHSQGLAVFAFSLQRDLGIDIEAIRSDVGPEDIATRFFSTREQLELRALPLGQRDEGFFLGWTRKEAYVKARGAGLGFELTAFHVSLTPGMPDVLISADIDRWMLRSFWPAEGFAGAVVAEGRDWTLRLLDGIDDD